MKEENSKFKRCEKFIKKGIIAALKEEDDGFREIS